MFQILKRIFSANLEENGTNNIVNNRDFPKCKFVIAGENNRIIISPDAKMTGKVFVYGDDNVIRIGSKSFLKGEIRIGRPNTPYCCNSKKCKLEIGRSVYVAETCRFLIDDDGTKVSIGDESIFAHGSEIWASDMHSCLDENGNLLNKASFVKIGNHVWVCTACKILRDSVVNDNSIVGACSVVNNVFPEKNALIAGNPATVVRHNVHWNKMSPSMYASQRE